MKTNNNSLNDYNETIITIKSDEIIASNITIENNSNIITTNNNTIHIDGDITDNNSINSNDTELDMWVMLNMITEQFANLSSKLNITNEQRRSIDDKLAKVRQLSQNLTRKLELIDIKTQFELNMITHQVISSLESKIFANLLDLNHQIEESKQILVNYDIKIEKLKHVLPNPNSVCLTLNSCNKCTSNPSCGWCGSSNQCVEGNNLNPLKGTCQFYSFEKCPNIAECSTYRKCNDCLQDVACGWCNNVVLNNPVCITKSEGESGLCNSNFFLHIWQKNSSLNSCPKITSQNYVSYISGELEKQQEDYKISQPTVTEIKVPYETMLNVTLGALVGVEVKKIQENINLDRLHKKHSQIEEMFDTLNKDDNVLDKAMALGDALKNESK